VTVPLLRPVQHSDGGVVYPQQRENFGVTQRVAPAIDDGEQRRIEPFEGRVNLTGDLRSDGGIRPPLASRMLPVSPDR
jgi:hypothetical protein